MRKNRFKITEELSISPIVDSMTDNLFIQITDKIKNSPKYFSKNNSFVISKGFFRFDCKNYLEHLSKLKVYYVVYYFKSLEEYKISDKYGLLNCSSDYGNGNIKLNLGYIDNKLSDDFKASIRHELKHIFEYDRGY